MEKCTDNTLLIIKRDRHAQESHLQSDLHVVKGSEHEIQGFLSRASGFGIVFMGLK